MNLWPLCDIEMGIESGECMRAEHIASYAYPPGRRERYTVLGWEMARRIGIAELRLEDFGAIGDSGPQE